MLTAPNTNNIQTQLSADGSKIFIEYYIPQEVLVAPNYYYKIINIQTGQLLWSKSFDGWQGTIPVRGRYINTPRQILDSFPSPNLTVIIVRQNFGEYSINLRDGTSIVISNPQITGTFCRCRSFYSTSNLYTGQFETKLTCILFSPQETHFLETTVTPSEQQLFTSRLITIQGKILLSHQFDKKWPVAL